MLVLVRKEALENLLTMRFFLGLAICAVLFSVVTIVFIGDYLHEIDQFRAVNQETENQISSWTVFNQIRPTIIRRPSPISIFSSQSGIQWGDKLNVAVSRIPVISADEAGSGTSSDFLAFFQNIDFSKVLQVFITLLAFLFSYDAICGEKERGSLKAMMSNPVSRTKIIVAKVIGIMFSLAVVIIISFAISALLLVFSPVAFQPADWLGFITVLLFTLILGFVFASLGVLISSLVQSNSVSLSIVLLAWVVIVVVYPNAVALAFDQQKLQDAYNQMESSLEELEKEYAEVHYIFSGEVFKDYMAIFWTHSEGEGMDQIFLYRFAGENAHKQMTERIPGFVSNQKEYALKRRDIELNYLSRKRELIHNLQFIQRLSPVVLFANACSDISQNGDVAYWNYIMAAKNYREELIQYMESKGAFNTIHYVCDDYQGMPAQDIIATIEEMTVAEQQEWVQANISRLMDEFFPLVEVVNDDQKRKLDLSDMPRFDNARIERSFADAGADALLLFVIALVFCAIAIYRFNSYDVR